MISTEEKINAVNRERTIMLRKTDDAEKKEKICTLIKDAEEYKKQIMRRKNYGKN